MILIKPLAIASDKLTSSIPEPDTAQGEVAWSAGVYTIGSRVVRSNAIYEVVADPSTTDDPLVGVDATPATWVYISPSNRYRMFDQANNTASVSDDLTVEITPVSLINSIACFNVNCSNITVTVYDVPGNIVYTNEITMRDRPNVNGWYNYYYSGFSVINKLVLLDIPPTTLGKVKVEFFGSGASVGTMIIGKQVMVGDAQYGTGAQLLDFSTPVEDAYGNISYTPGFTAKLIDYDIMANTKDIDPIFVEFQNLGKSPAVFVGNPSNIGDSTLVYGIVRDFNPVYTWATKSKISLTVRGLI